MLTQLDGAIQKASGVGSAVHQSTDVSENAKLLVYASFFNTDKKEFCEDLLGVTPFQTRTSDEDVNLSIKGTLTYS